MGLSAFIKNNVDALVADWEATAHTLPAARTMTAPALHGHCRGILLAVAADMSLPPSDGQGVAPSEAVAATPASTRNATSATSATEQGALQQRAGSDMAQLFAEFRALRKQVMLYWQGSSEQASGAAAMADAIRFNECMDQALADSVHRHAGELDASRDRFLAVLGHDLRGPLSGINMSVMLLAKAGLSEDSRHQAAARIKRASAEMTHLVTDLLEYARSRTGVGIPISRAACNLGPVCEAALEPMRAGWPEQLFAEQMSGDLNLQADADRLKQALSNLLSNAAQHSDRSAPVTLSASGEVDAVVLKVSNAGEAISPDALQAIFEPLVQAPGASAPAHEHPKNSLGLGLFIVREIVLGHGGSVSVESSAAAGTVFTVRLPRTADTAA